MDDTLFEAVLFMSIKKADSWQGRLFHLFLSEYDNQSDNFTNVEFLCDVAPLFSVLLKTV